MSNVAHGGGGVWDAPVEWSPEERPVGEHAWRTDGRCGVCGAIASNGPVLSAERCPSKRERRLVTPWEPVPQETGGPPRDD